MTPRRGPVVPTLLVAGAHLAVAALDGMRRSVFQWPPADAELARLGDWDSWVALHIVLAVGIVGAVWSARPRLMAVACRASVGVLGLWSALALLWGLTAPVPVSLVGSTFGLLLTGVGLWCSTQWTYATPRRHRG